MSNKEESDAPTSVEFSQAGTEYFDPALQRTSGPSMSKAEQKVMAEKMKAGAAESEPPEIEISKKTGRRLYVMRHAERLDRIFPGWLQLAVTDTNKYRPFDLNMPMWIPIRAGGMSNYNNDSPLTETGHVFAQMIGRGMQLNKNKLTRIITSPALRCVQTAYSLVKTFEKPVPICIEPGLFEWMGWYETPPVFLSLNEITSSYKGLSVDKNYQPAITTNELLNNYRQEETARFFQRQQDVITKILAKYPGPDSTMIIGHGATLEAIPRKLLGKQVAPLSKNEMDRLGLNYPYCALVAIEELKNGAWKAIHNPIPPISCVDFTNRLNAQWFNR